MKWILFCIIFFLCTLNLFANKNDLSDTVVKNAKKYQDSPYTSLNANDETIIKGTADIVLEFERIMYRWDNRVYANYGKSTVKDNMDGTKTVSETADELIFTSDYTMKLWKVKRADIGSFVSVAY